MGRVSKTVTVNTKQGRLTVYTNDSDIGKTIYCRRDFELEQSVKAVEFLRQTGGTILDVGANMGVISIGFVKNNWARRAIAIEPGPANFMLLQRNVRQNGMEARIICLPYAVSNVSGTVDFELNSRNLGDHRVRIRTNEKVPELEFESQRPVIEVKSRCLDDVMAEVPGDYRDNLSLIWIDTQGHEGRIFSGGRSAFSRDIPVMAEICPYTVMRSGVSKREFQNIIEQYWSTYWIIRRGRYFPYRISLFGMYWDELGDAGDFENVIFTK